MANSGIKEERVEAAPTKPTAAATVEVAVVDKVAQKFKDAQVDLSLLKYEAPSIISNHFLEVTNDPPQPKFHESFQVSVFKLILFRQELGHWTVPPKEVMLYHWLKNQTRYMMEYEELSRRKKENPFTRSSQYYNL